MTYIVILNGQFDRRVPEGNVVWGPNHFQPASTLSADERKKFGVFFLEPADMPAFDDTKQYIEETTPTLSADKWWQTWAILDMTPEQIDADRAGRAFSLRRDRGNRLAACDWTRLDDVPKIDKPAWAKYRQLLRDVPGQADFPYSVIWPEVP